MKPGNIRKAGLLIQAVSLVTASNPDDAQVPLSSRKCLPQLEYVPTLGINRCFDDTAGLRALDGVSFKSKHNNVQSCAGVCGRAGYTLVGIKHNRSKECICGDLLNIEAFRVAGTMGGCESDEAGAKCEVRRVNCNDEDAIEVYDILNPLAVAKAPANLPDCSRDPLCSTDVCDESLSDRDRAAALVSRLTIWEKLDNLVNEAPGVPRLGLPPYEWWSEGLHGVASSPGTRFAPEGNFSYATSFPQPIVLGSAFDDELARAVGEVVSKETRAFGNAGRSGLDLYTPNINAFKDPRWGRGQETPGEDTLHLQNYVSAMLTGLEGSDASSSSKKSLLATCKHYAANDFEHYETVDRSGFDAQISTQDLSEYYLPPFKTCAVEKKVASFMCSYNGVNGTPLCANAYLLETVLRRHWGWDGDGRYVSTDCDCVALMVSHHRYAPDLGHAAAWSMRAGTDLECNASPGSEALQSAWNQSLVSEAHVDRALTRLYTALVSVGLFDSGRADPLRSLGWADVDTQEARKLAYRAAVQGAVLLKNDGVLPLPKEAKQKYALVGPWVEATTQMQGNYFGPAPYLLSPYRAAQDLGIEFTYTLGSRMNGSDDSFEEAMASAKNADTIIFMGGVDNTLEAETLDRKTLAWPQPQLELLRALSALGKPIVVLQFGGGQVDDTELLANASINAILWAGYPGQSGGKVIIDIIFGTAAPAGRLSVTQYPASYNEAVPSTDMDLRPGPGNSGLGRTYRWYTGETPVPFGFGLHYTTFDVGLVVRGKQQLDRTDQAVHLGGSHDVSGTPNWHHVLTKPVITVAVSATNTGETTSDYVALVFMRSDVGPEPRPLKTLVGYTRLRDIKPGATVTQDIVITIESYQLFVDVDNKASQHFVIKGSPVLIERFPQPKANLEEL
ncbi:putative exo-1,4-beta-xylosidase bxlB [Colletotrichum orbiculare MAFF 240422]|uniref:xylan 1,4-beta-xylosidase n=1 Tax=Colletotrichum orbiculare (strain 104-T / ATCC 96160 / CBS 514.97 / LARS 414 / MAFF 240422) TaxID=1213857 RepID=A0A484FFG8_COLOR|nr:putative exo-1,4-beta-xylosidase bxlB [Colletotrichum orbiculare MAFF 240422]